LNILDKLNEWDLRLIFPGGSDAPEMEIFRHAISHTGSVEIKEETLVNHTWPDIISESQKKKERLSGVE